MGGGTNFYRSDGKYWRKDDPNGPYYNYNKAKQSGAYAAATQTQEAQRGRTLIEQHRAFDSLSNREIYNWGRWASDHDIPSAFEAYRQNNGQYPARAANYADRVSQTVINDSVIGERSNGRNR